MGSAARVLTMLGAAIVLVVGVTGCASTREQSVSDALSATRTARLALQLDEDGRLWTTTLPVVLADAAGDLADAAHTLSLDPAASQESLDAVREALDAVRRAETQDAAAPTDLDAAVDRLEALE